MNKEKCAGEGWLCLEKPEYVLLARRMLGGEDEEFEAFLAVLDASVRRAKPGGGLRSSQTVALAWETFQFSRELRQSLEGAIKLKYGR